MASFLDKVQTLISADLNRWTDRALRSNEPAIFQHQIRELQKMQEQLNDQLISARVELNEMRKRSEEQQALVVKQDAEVDQLLQAGLQEDALAAQDRVNSIAHGCGAVERAGGAAGDRVCQHGRGQGPARRAHCDHDSERAAR